MYFQDQFELLTPAEKEQISQQIPLKAISKITLFSLLRHHSSIVFSLILLVFIALLGLCGPLFSPYSYSETDLPSKNMPPCKEHILGTDDLGRDLFTRLSYGLRISLMIGLASAAIDLVIGASWGLLAGFLDGSIGYAMMRIADLVYSLPYLLFVILVTVVVGPGFISILSAMVMIGWIQMARIVRAQVIQMKQAEFVMAAVALGLSPKRILFAHIVPNIAGPIIAAMMLTIPYAIFAEAFLSFLGIGIQPPLASLGSMVSDAIPAMRYYPWRLFFPACIITLVIFAFNLLGDGLRDLLDPHVKNQLINAKA